jgi:hypothetical protein
VIALQSDVRTPPTLSGISAFADGSHDVHAPPGDTRPMARGLRLAAELGLREGVSCANANRLRPVTDRC